MRSCLALIVAIFLSQTACIAALAQSPVERWTRANLRAIAHMRDPKKRSAARRTFANTLVLLESERKARPTLNPPHDPKVLAQSILADHRLYRFSQAETPPPKTWWERALAWVGEQWSRVMRALFGRVHMPGRVNLVIADILLALCILVFLAILVRIGWLYARPARSPSAPARLLSQSSDAAILLAKSLAAAQRGAYAAAVARLFAAAISLLNLRRRFEGRRSETVGEIGWRVRVRDPRLAEPFERLAVALTRAIYAEHALNADDWARSIAAYRQLESLVSDERAA